MWLEMIIDGAVVTFSHVGTSLDSMGRDLRCEWAPKIESEARKICAREDGIMFTCIKGDLSIRLHVDAVQPVIRAIAEAEPSMPLEIRGFYQRISYLLENGERTRLTESWLRKPQTSHRT